jgi:hypothetical protein
VVAVPESCPDPVVMVHPTARQLLHSPARRAEPGSAGIGGTARGRRTPDRTVATRRTRPTDPGRRLLAERGPPPPGQGLDHEHQEGTPRSNWSRAPGRDGRSGPTRARTADVVVAGNLTAATRGHAARAATARRPGGGRDVRVTCAPSRGWSRAVWQCC